MIESARVLDYELRGHLKAAIDVHVDKLRFFDQPIPDALTSFLALLAEDRVVFVSVADIPAAWGPLASDAARVHLTYTEAAQRLGISTRTVRDYVRSGKVIAVGHGRGRRILASSLYEFASTRETTA